MAQTVVGFFDSAAEAQQAVQQLVSRGISRENIDLSSRGTQASTTSYSDTDQDDGSVSKFFKNLFADDDNESEKYSRVGSKSGSIVTVHAQTSSQAEEAADILDDAGAFDVDERAAQYGLSGSTASGLTGATDLSSTTNEAQKVSVIEENLQVGKREIQTGGKRLRSRIIERSVEESLRLREETVTVNRTPVDRPATSADLANFQGTEIEMTQSKEVPVVSKEARVVEEVSLGKEATERTETISDTVRETKVDIEDINTNSSSTKTSDYNDLSDKSSI